jgi:hypothetical protein
MDSKFFIIDNLFLLRGCNIKDNIKMGLKNLFKRVQVNSCGSVWGAVVVVL